MKYAGALTLGKFIVALSYAHALRPGVVKQRVNMQSNGFVPVPMLEK